MKNIVILGSTGSIGTQTLDIISRMPDRFRIVGLSAHENIHLLLEQCAKWKPSHACLVNPEKAEELRSRLSNTGIHVREGVDGMCELATLPEVDLIVMAVAGAVGIRPTHAALRLGKDIALASKEVLVAAGEHTMALAKQNNASIIPIDSEHSAIFQSMQGAPQDSVETLILTASGGPFRDTPKQQLADVTPEQALRHPTWNMGGLVTINSSTLFNKGLEIIEARWLFDISPKNIQVVIHPQSILHSGVRFRDGSIIAQLGLPDMRLPIQYALMYPERPDTGLPRLDLTSVGSLTFDAPDEDKFPALRLAKEAVRIGGTLPAVMNAANEIAVSRFLERKISYTDIMSSVEKVMGMHSPAPSTYDNVLQADAWARTQALTA
jgi:1-deoxy-D-xylulose-5-phosphate reductoisomerase